MPAVDYLFFVCSKHLFLSSELMRTSFEHRSRFLYYLAGEVPRKYSVTGSSPSPSAGPINSASYAGMNEWEDSAKDAAQCIKVNKGFVKGTRSRLICGL